ncbi:hypothetical protein [Nitrosococcus watsonii]|uniref:Uncharacterized protein n=1 Tax=Nitrosococcus watsoni (strain C-113) TaxID=105559 RepID=D8KCG1_NITWC|nr:hypothetical protein [Nitrosococcus watsonii]ADJ29902.1 hypothetical protein Nwat_3189 [Nitrosococcus watsonii C-113]
MKDPTKLKQKFWQAVEATPEDRREELLQLVQTFAVNAKQQPAHPLPTNLKEMRKLGIKLYPEFKQETGSTDSEKCLRQNWGEWLKAYNPKLDRDYMSLADIRKLDPQLLGRLKKQYKTDELHKFLPSLPLVNKQIANNMTDDERREIGRLNALYYTHV